MLKMLGKFINVDTLFVAVNDGLTNTIVTALNKRESLAAEGDTPFNDAYCSLVDRQADGVLIISDTVTHDWTREMAVTRELGRSTFIGIPIRLKDEGTVGTICAMNRENYDVSEREIELLKMMAAFLSNVIELERVVFRDAVTQVLNRNFIDSYLVDFQTNHRAIGCLFLDVDNFKEINDTFNHSVGDEVLRQVAKRIQRHAGETDILCRIGGDEFVLLVMDDKDAHALEEKTKQILQDCLLPMHLSTATINVTMSIGISCYPEDADNPRELIKQADRAMYLAKRAGKNRFHRFDEVTVRA